MESPHIDIQSILVTSKTPYVYITFPLSGADVHTLHLHFDLLERNIVISTLISLSYSVFPCAVHLHCISLCFCWGSYRRKSTTKLPCSAFDQVHFYHLPDCVALICAVHSIHWYWLESLALCCWNFCAVLLYYICISFVYIRTVGCPVNQGTKSWEDVESSLGSTCWWRGHEVEYWKYNQQVSYQPNRKDTPLKWWLGNRMQLLVPSESEEGLETNQTACLITRAFQWC